jgi:HK97 family phage major capsid protein
VNAALTNGTGTVQPRGIVTAAGSGVTGGTAGGFTADNLIDLAYTNLDGAVRRLPGVGYMAAGQTIGAMRKLKDTAGNYLYQVGVGQPDTFAGFSVIENPHVPTAAGLRSLFYSVTFLPTRFALPEVYRLHRLRTSPSTQT